MLYESNETSEINENIKIEKSYLEKINKLNINLFFGDWINDIEKLKSTFVNAEPFEHIVIDDFLNDKYAEKLSNVFPNDYEKWHKYENPIEVKYAFDNINILPEELKNYFYILSTKMFIYKIQKLTDIDELEYDEYLHGAGLHSHSKNGRLNIHLDYEKHPYSGKERRINIILFLSKEWKKEWNGANELWNKDISKCIVKTDVKFNRAIIFKTNDISWHGVPDKILCPNNIYRNSLAYYYVSPFNTIKPFNKYREKARYSKRLNDKYDENMEKLYKIRQKRRITKEDMNKYFPYWSVNK
jgi:Rps23 Pro-64 3,4-dihydroxylase Tpa1-like proline 4-hydroxylase